MKTLLPSTLIVLIVTTYTTASYQVGIGIYDCTGPAAGVTFMGYAKSSQVGCGIHLRQFARAFIIDDGETRIAYVTVDTCMISHGLKKEVLSRLRKRYNDTYGYQNVILSGTHTHSAPGGFMMDMLYDIPDKGFVGETFMALADGITKAVIKAHANIVEAQIYVTAGEIVDANINRSPYSYLNNPEEERAKYKYNTDKDIVQLKFVRSSDDVPIGSINWYAVHPTSMNNTNCLITSDNVGYASLLLEQFVNGGTIVGKKWQFLSLKNLGEMNNQNVSVSLSRKLFMLIGIFSIAVINKLKRGRMNNRSTFRIPISEKSGYKKSLISKVYQYIFQLSSKLFFYSIFCEEIQYNCNNLKDLLEIPDELRSFLVSEDCIDAML